MTTDLPLSQQIVAWILRALGFGDMPGPGVSRSTLRNAQTGELIPASWDELVASLLRWLKPSAPLGEVLAVVGPMMREWDIAVSTLPSARELSLRQRLR
jgi:hypothetical protein